MTGKGWLELVVDAELELAAEDFAVAAVLAGQLIQEESRTRAQHASLQTQPFFLLDLPWSLHPAWLALCRGITNPHGHPEVEFLKDLLLAEMPVWNGYDARR